jgi:hypothetical protein
MAKMSEILVSFSDNFAREGSQMEGFTEKAVTIAIRTASTRLETLGTSAQPHNRACENAFSTIMGYQRNRPRHVTAWKSPKKPRRGKVCAQIASTASNSLSRDLRKASSNIVSLSKLSE